LFTTFRSIRVDPRFGFSAVIREISRRAGRVLSLVRFAACIGPVLTQR
jgi:hypothetical protein